MAKGSATAAYARGPSALDGKRKLLGHGPVALKMLSAKALSRTVSLRDTTRWYTPRRRPSRADMTSLEPQALLGRCAVDAATMRTHTRLLAWWVARTDGGGNRAQGASVPCESREGGTTLTHGAEGGDHRQPRERRRTNAIEGKRAATNLLLVGHMLAALHGPHEVERVVRERLVERVRHLERHVGQPLLLRDGVGARRLLGR